MNCLLEKLLLRSGLHISCEAINFSTRAGFFYSSKSADRLICSRMHSSRKRFFWQRQTMKQKKSFSSKVDLTKCLPKKNNKFDVMDFFVRGRSRPSLSPLTVHKKCFQVDEKLWETILKKHFAIILMASEHHGKVTLRKNNGKYSWLELESFFCENMDKWE